VGRSSTARTHSKNTVEKPTPTGTLTEIFSRWGLDYPLDRADDLPTCAAIAQLLLTSVQTATFWCVALAVLAVGGRTLSAEANGRVGTPS
jgi:hypothetical protein